MFDHHDWTWGMHWGWWIVWIAVTALAILLLVRSIRTGPDRKSPLEILEERYIRGDISKEDYEERRSRLLRDRG